MIKTVGGEPHLTNLVLVSHNSEYQHNFNKYCKKFMVQIRNRKSVRVAFEPGATATTYLSLGTGSSWWEDLVLGPFTAYFKSDADDVVVEILEWTSKD